MGIVRQANGFSTDAFSSLLLSLVSSFSRAPSPLVHRTRGPKSKKHASSHLHRGESARDLLPGSVVLALHSSSDAAPSSTARRRRWRPPKVVHLELVQRRHGAGHELRRRLGLVLVQHAVEEGHLVSRRDERGNAKKMKRVKKKFLQKKERKKFALKRCRCSLAPRPPLPRPAPPSPAVS